MKKILNLLVVLSLTTTLCEAQEKLQTAITSNCISSGSLTVDLANSNTYLQLKGQNLTVVYRLGNKTHICDCNLKDGIGLALSGAKLTISKPITSNKIPGSIKINATQPVDVNGDPLPAPEIAGFVQYGIDKELRFIGIDDVRGGFTQASGKFLGVGKSFNFSKNPNGVNLSNDGSTKYIFEWYDKNYEIENYQGPGKIFYSPLEVYNHFQANIFY